MWLPSSRQVGFLHPILKGMGICYGLLPLYLLDIPASKDSIGGSRKWPWRRHSRAGGSWQWYFISFISMALLGWLNEAHICHANFLQSGTPGNANSSLHQSGVLVASAFHVTHVHNSSTGGSRGGPSSSELSTNLVRKEVAPGSNSGRSARSESSGVSSSSRDPISSLASGKVVWVSLNCTWCCLFLHSVDPCIRWSLLFDLALTSSLLWERGQLNLSISPSRAAAMASTFWWAYLMVARLCSNEISLFPGTPLFEGWVSLDQGLAVALEVLLSLHPWQPSKEDTTSCIS